MPRGRKPTRRDTENQTNSAADDAPVPPFFNTTFSTHQVSPLYVGSQRLTPSRLETLARRLRDTLVGDVVRGIQIGVEAMDTPAGQVGPLRKVKIRWFQAKDVLGSNGSFADLNDADEDQSNGSLQNTDQGLWIELGHENASYVAILLPGPNGPSQVPQASGWLQPASSTSPSSHSHVDQSQFLHLPLMLLRMPLPLKNVICDWFSTTFDCRATKLSFGTKTLVSVWETWIQESVVSNKGADFVLTLAFNTPLQDSGTGNKASSNKDVDGETDSSAQGSGLRTMDITISPPDLKRFVRAGKADDPRRIKAGPWTSDPRERRKLAGGNTDDGWAWCSGKRDSTQPFTEALALYLDHHLALNLFHPSVRITQISCGGFVLAQSRLKLVRSGDMTEEFSRAAWMFVMKLAERLRVDISPPLV